MESDVPVEICRACGAVDVWFDGGTPTCAVCGWRRQPGELPLLPQQSKVSKVAIAVSCFFGGLCLILAMAAVIGIGIFFGGLLNLC